MNTSFFGECVERSTVPSRFLSKVKSSVVSRTWEAPNERARPVMKFGSPSLRSETDAAGCSETPTHHTSNGDNYNTANPASKERNHTEHALLKETRTHTHTHILKHTHAHTHCTPWRLVCLVSLSTTVPVKGFWKAYWCCPVTILCVCVCVCVCVRAERLIAFAI